MKFVQQTLRVFDFDPWAMRGRHFFAGILDYRGRILPMNRGRILPPAAYRCRLCGGTEGETLLEWEEGYQVVECNACGFATANFSIGDQSAHIDLAYNNDTYYQKFLDEIVAHYEYRKMNMGKERYSYVIERLGLNNGNTRLLDVGCGAGWFISYAQDRGLSCKGLEINPMAVRFCRERGLDVLDSRLEEEPSGTYDVITFFDVLEHLDEPLAVVAAAHRTLKSGGYLVAYTPNIHSIAYELMGAQQNTLLPFEHTGFFDERSFHYLAAHTGFAVHTLEVFGFDLMDYLLMKEYQDGYAYTQKLREMMLLVQACLDKLGVGNHSRLTLRKAV